jgi:glycosyltransferase involved in cell wall biosynthesis
MRGNTIVVLESESYFDVADSHIVKTYVYRDYEAFGRNLALLRGFNMGFALKLLKLLRNESIDLIQLTHPSGALAVRLLSRITNPNTRVVYDAHNVESEFVMETFVNYSKYSKLEKMGVPRYISLSERIACKYSVDFIVSVTGRDREMLIRKHGIDPSKIEALPSCGIDTDLGNRLKRSEIRHRMNIGEDMIVAVFHGIYSHLPNKEAFEFIERYIAPMFETMDKRILFLVGGNGVPEFTHKNVRSVGFIENLDEFLAMADIAIVPLVHGAGIKLKVLDYMKYGIPMVVTRKGIEGIEAEEANAAIVVDEVNQDFIEAMKHLITDKEMRRMIGENARRLADKDYDWTKIGERMNDLFNELVARP